MARAVYSPRSLSLVSVTSVVQIPRLDSLNIPCALARLWIRLQRLLRLDGLRYCFLETAEFLEHTVGTAWMTADLSTRSVIHSSKAWNVRICITEWHRDRWAGRKSTREIADHLAI